VVGVMKKLIRTRANADTGFETGLNYSTRRQSIYIAIAVKKGYDTRF